MARIAILGSRGLPIEGLSFKGFEAFIAGLAPRLVQRGHQVTVYCRRDLYSHRPLVWDGVRLRYVPSIESKALGTPLHMTLSTLDALTRRYDSILVVNSGNGLQCGLLRLASRARVGLNMDGVEWERGKWGRMARAYFKFASLCGGRWAHVAIADSRAIGNIYRAQFGIETEFIPYAADPYDSDDSTKVRHLGLVPNGYGLIVGRMVPENKIDVLVRGFAAAGTLLPLVVVGGENYRSDYHRRLAALADPNTRFLGHVHDQDLLWQLFRHARMYLHGHSVGGTNPALLQALATSSLIGANDVVFNREVVGNAGSFFTATPEAVADVVRHLYQLSPEEVAAFRAAARDRLQKGGYTWERVVEDYERALVQYPS